MKKRAFTLIELLVVIAIIGILTGIVLVSLRGARARARDARIRADIEQTRSIAEMIYDRDGNYSNLCSGNALNSGDSDYGTQLDSIATDINTQNAGQGVPECYASGDDYCVSARLATGSPASPKFICISSAGMVGDDQCTAADSTCD